MPFNRPAGYGRLPAAQTPNKWGTFMRHAIFFVAFCLATPAWAEFTGRVLYVNDGDTLTMRVDGKRVKVRLDGIDAPERGQPYAKSSRTSLVKLCMDQQAKVTDRGKDEEGLVLGSVTCRGKDANGEQVRQGLAWVYKRYIPMGSPLYEMESNARLQGIGLWQADKPVPPWEWREQKAKAAAEKALAAKK